MDVLPICRLALQATKPKPLGYPSKPKTLGEHLKKRRMDLGLSQRDVAERVGADTTSVWNWENNWVAPDGQLVPAILTFLGYDPRPAAGSLGERLVRFREGRGWSQKRLATELGVNPTTLSRWELDKKIPWGNYAIRVNALLATEP